MSETQRIGVEIDSSLWQEFREDVNRRHGRTSGVLATEVENALRQYIYTGDKESVGEKLTTLNDRMKRIESQLGASAPDGGTDVSSAETHTHAPAEPTVEEKPGANAATNKKVVYLAEQVRAVHNGSFQEVARSVLVETVKEEYSFRSDTAKRYVDRLVEHFDLVEHPTVDGILVTPDREAEIIEQRREQLADELEDDPE